MIDVKNNKRLFIELAKENITRDGIDQLIDYLEKRTDFFTAPCSTKFHLCEDGGLCQHSLNVYSIMIDLCNMFDISVVDFCESITIMALFHDLCKTNFYKKVTKNVKQGTMWVNTLGYDIDDKLPLGHGEKSVMILQEYLHLTNDEMLAIRWHMGAWDSAAKGGARELSAAQDMSKFVTLLQCADQLAARMME